MQTNPSNQHHQPPHQHKRPAGFLQAATAAQNHRPSTTTRCLKIAPEERRYAQFEVEQSRILKEIMQKTNTRIEVTATKDGALNFCIVGKEANINAAVDLVLNNFQTPVTLTVSVPKSVHGRLLGPKGVRLASIQEETQTKINMPRKEEDSDVIRVVGLKDNAERAVQSIQKYVKEFVGKAVEKVNVERIYLLFITGPFNENLKRWETMGVKALLSGGYLPNSNNSNNNTNSHHNNNNHYNSSNNHSNDSSKSSEELTFTLSGETQAVNAVKAEILQIYEDRKKKCTTVNIEVKKAQHKYILGPGGQNLRNLFAKTGVSVELPNESESETITLRGELSKLGPALSELYSQAHSEMDFYFEVENWLHKYLIGPRKMNNIDFKTRGVDVKSLDDKIKIHGPPAEVESIRDTLELELSAIKKSIVRKDIRVEPRIHGYIIGKSGATVEQIREESGAFIMVPKADENISEFISLEGTLEAVNLAEEKINAIAKKYEASRKLVIDQQLHGSIIGKGGEKIRGIREKFSQVVFTFPEQGSNSDEVTILGPNDEVEACYNYLNEFHKQLQENNHQAQIPIKGDVVKYVADFQPAIRRLKVDNKVKIDIFINNKDITSASKSQTKSSEPQSNEVNQLENNQVVSDKSKTSKNAKPVKKQPQSKDQTPQTGQNRNVAKGNHVNSNNVGDNYAVVIGKKEDVDAAKVKLAKLFEEIATTVELELKMPSKLYSHLNAKSKHYRQLMDEFQNKVVITFVLPEKKAKSAQNNTSIGIVESTGGDEPKNLSNNTKAANGIPNKEGNGTQNVDVTAIVKIRAPKNIAKKVEKKFETLISECQEKVDKSYQTQVAVPAAIIKKFLYADKSKLNKMREAHNVKILIPDKKSGTLQVQIVGYEKNVQAALVKFNKLVQEVEERIEVKIEIPSEYHPRLIGAGGRVVKKLMEDYKVEVKFARQDDPNPDFVTIFGNETNADGAKMNMLKMLQTLINRNNSANNGTEPNHKEVDDSNIVTSTTVTN